MKIMLPIENNRNGKVLVARGFHNARRICIYDSNTKIFEWLSTQSFSSNPEDLSMQIKGMGIQSVISGYMPPMVLRIFTCSGLQAYKSRGNNLEENICFFTNNQLESFTSQFTREAWSCQSSCGSCGSTLCN